MSPRPTSLLAVLAIGGAVFACHHENQLTTIHLEWKADGKVGYKDSVLKAIADKRLALAVIDKRDDKAVGHYNAKNGGAHTVTTNEDVVAFCSTVFKDQLRTIGVPFVDSGQAFTLRAELQDYRVAETDGYHAHVAVHFALVDNDGKEAWAHTLEDKTDRGGMDHTEDNYNENLSEALKGVMKQLLTSAEFESGITGQPIAAPEAVLPPPKLPSGPVLHLEWRGIDASRSGGADATLKALRSVTIDLKPLIDGRTNPLAIGRFENAKNATVYTPDNVAKFYGVVLTERLKTLGVQLTTTGAAFELQTELLELTVIEADEFHGLARVRFTITKQGSSVWSGVFEGKSKRAGKDHDRGLMNECLSSAYDDVMHGFSSSTELVAALKK